MQQNHILLINHTGILFDRDWMMKKFLAVFILLAIPFSALMAQPIANFLKNSHDFGEIKEVDGPVSTDYLFVNSGNKPLFLTEVKPSCGCTEPDWTKDTIYPGDTGFVRAKFNPANMPGPFEKVVYIETNGAPIHTTLLFKGTVIPRPIEIWDIYPLEQGRLRMNNNFLSFGTAYSGEIDSTEIKLYNQSDKDIWISSVTNAPLYVNFETPSHRLRPKEEAVMKVKFDTKASGRWGEHNYVFYLNTLDSPATSNIPIYAQIIIKEKFPKMTKKQLDKAPKIQVDAQMMYLGKLVKGDSIDFQFTLTNMGQEKLIIRSVNTLCGCTVSSVDKKELKRGESTILRGRFNSEGREGPQEKYITVVSNDPVTPELRLGFTAEIVTNPNALKY